MRWNAGSGRPPVGPALCDGSAAAVYELYFWLKAFIYYNAASIAAKKVLPHYNAASEF